MTVWTFTDADRARILDLEGANNFRDLGGWQAEDGRRLDPGRIYRAAVLSGLTAVDHTRLAESGFSDVIDLRSAVEQDRYPTAGLNPHDHASGPRRGTRRRAISGVC